MPTSLSRFVLPFCLALLTSAPLCAQQLYAVTGAGNVESILYTISPVTGTVLQTIGDLHTTHVTGLAFSPTTGVLYGHISNAPTTTQLITINPTTATFSVVGNTGQQVPSMTFRADGTLFAWSKLNVNTSVPDEAYRIDVTTAQATLISSTTFATNMAGLAFAPDGTLYLKNRNDLYTVNPTNGATTFIKTLTGAALVNSLVFDPNGTPYSIVRTNNHSFLATFDMNSGQVTTLGEILAGGQPVNGVAGLAFAAVPEPSSLLLAAAGLLGASVVVWRKRRRVNTRA